MLNKIVDTRRTLLDMEAYKTIDSIVDEVLLFLKNVGLFYIIFTPGWTRWNTYNKQIQYVVVVLLQ